jgi:hypothetical protein
LRADAVRAVARKQKEDHFMIEGRGRGRVSVELVAKGDGDRKEDKNEVLRRSIAKPTATLSEPELPPPHSVWLVHTYVLHRNELILVIVLGF